MGDRRSGGLMTAGCNLLQCVDRRTYVFGRGEWADAQANGTAGGESSNGTVGPGRAVQSGAGLDPEGLVEDCSHLLRFLSIDRDADDADPAVFRRRTRQSQSGNFFEPRQQLAGQLLRAVVYR